MKRNQPSKPFDPATHYRCAVCDGIFEKGWSDEEAATEFAVTVEFAGVALEDCDLVCDDCYKKMNAHFGYTKRS